MGQTIKRARLARQIDQGALAKTVGVKRQAVSAWENGHNWPQARQRYVLQQALGIEIPDEPEPMAPVEAIPGTHAPGIRYACAAIAQTVADLYRMAADAERLAGLADERERLIQQTQAAARPPASAAPTRRQRSK
jgi:transcriptional regulator with XRE-family HTH domain